MLTIVLVLCLITAVASIITLIQSLGSLSKNSNNEMFELKDVMAEVVDRNFGKHRSESGELAKQAREEVQSSFSNFSNSISNQFKDLNEMQKNALDHFSKGLKSFEEKILKSSKETRLEVMGGFKEFESSLGTKFKTFLDSNTQMRQEIEKKLDIIRGAVETKLQSLQDDNSKKLEQMRETVDEKLKATVEERFDKSFKLIGDQFTQVQKDLGEMRTLATGVGDLKKVLSNVKTRGNIGEIQLGRIIEQYFASTQYEKNATTKKGSSQRVEYAIKIPGKDSDDEIVLLPIDSKFPIESYERLMDAYEKVDGTNQRGSKSDLESAKREFQNSVMQAGKDIKEKYLNPPYTTDFGIMFVPTEGLYAEVLRSQLFQHMQKNYNVVVLGPTTIVAFLNALQMGFRTLAIEKKSSEVYKTLGAVKTEFSKFTDALSGVKNKINQTVSSIENAELRSRQIEKKLKQVEALPQQDATKLGIFDTVLDLEDEQKDS